MGPDFVSAVICTRNRSGELRRCLEAMSRQTLPAAQFETILVDNGSTDATHEVVMAAAVRQPNLRYVTEERTGLAIARNTGVRHAAGEIVAFTDDDAEPEPTWLQRALARYNERPVDCGIVGGEVIPVFETQRPAWLSDALLRPLSAGLNWGPVARSIRPGEWLVEVNSIYRKAALAAVGGFPEHLGRSGESLLSGEGGINVVIQRAGWGLFYDPAILVRHHIPAVRLTKAWFRRRSFWQGVSINRLNRFVEETSARLGFTDPERPGRFWEELAVPTSPSGWAALFDDDDDMALPGQLVMLEHLGYLLESQSAVIGR